MTDTEYLKEYLDEDKLEEGLKKLKEGFPVQYIIGNVNFYGNTIFVNPNVLIPRFETELLVEKTINYIKETFANPTIIDLGTGSGAIAITLKKNLKCKVDAVDISDKALIVAKNNANENKVTINFFKNDMLNNIKKKYDVIISNPPYISYDEEIEEIVKQNEPALALFAENNGLEYYEKILSQVNNCINKKALIAFEIGKDQAPAIKKIINKYLPNSKVSIEKDFTGKNRYIFIFVNIL